MFLLGVLVTELTSCTSTNKLPQRSDEEILYKKLSWADFKGKIDTSLKYYAMTYWSVSYNYDKPIFDNDNSLVKIKVSYKLNENSWYRPNRISDTLLNHEQGHFNMAYLLALDLKKTYNNNSYTKDNYNKKIDSIYNALEAKYLKLELLYDKETNHMYNQQEQKKWDKFFENEAKRLK